MKTDTAIKQDVLDELVWQPNIDETQIGVIVEDGVVTLTGFVNEFQQKLAAENAAKSVAGVKAVADDIQVTFGDDFKKTDKEIAKAVVNALEWNSSVPTDKIMVKVDDGYIYLTGEVTWKYQRDAAKRTIEHLQGVKGVNNTIDIVQKIAPKEVKEKIQKAFQRSADLDAAQVVVNVQGSEVTLTGTVSSIKEKEEAEKATFHAPGVTKVKNKIKVQFKPTDTL
jgi:osmotically-inducible protein OsmY